MIANFTSVACRPEDIHRHLTFLEAELEAMIMLNLGQGGEWLSAIKARALDCLLRQVKVKELARKNCYV